MSDPLIGRVVLGRYRVVRMLGQGGMGQVYLAEQSMGSATRPVALKALRKELMGDPKVSGRFLRESEIVIRLAHPNTIQFHDFGQLDDGTLVIVMEYIEGRTLAEELRRGPLSLSRVDALMAQICGSLAEAHARGIVHRDLKPHNVLLTTRAGQDDFVKVVDFGIAVRRGDDETGPTRLTTQGTMIGTPPYMSPEQFQDRDVDPRSDVYSLGVMLYEMLTGALPFEAKSAWQWAAAHLEQAPKPIAEHPGARELPAARAQCVMRALEKDPERRPCDAGDLLHVWSRAASGPSTGAAMPAAEQAGKAEGGDPEVFVAPTLRAPLPARAKSTSTLSWVPVVALVAVGAAMTWGGGHLGFALPATESDGEARTRLDQGAALAKRQRGQRKHGSEARAPGDEAPRADMPSGAAADALQARADAGLTPVEPTVAERTASQADASNVEAHLSSARHSLGLGDAVAAARALRRAHSVQPDHRELPELRTQLAEVVAATAATMTAAESCARLRELAHAATHAGTEAPDPLTQALRTCDGPPNSRVDAGGSSASTE